MPSPQQSPAFKTIAPSDTGARLAHLQDLIAEHAGERRVGLVTDYHEAAAAGAMHATDGGGVILITVITRDGGSHVYSLPRPIADHLRQQLIALRTGIDVTYNRTLKEPIRKPNGRIL